MNVALLLSLLLKLATVEWPTVMDDKPANVKYRNGVKTMTELYVSVGSEGALISREADPIVLAVIGYEESRHRPRVKDGDCGIGNTCNAIGPMQLSKASPWFLSTIDPTWKGLKMEKLRDPETSVRGAYAMLKHWKKACPGTPSHWLGAWSAGKCFGKRPIDLGSRRCEMASAIAKASKVDFEECGGRNRSRRLPRLLEALKSDQPSDERKAK